MANEIVVRNVVDMNLLCDIATELLKNSSFANSKEFMVAMNDKLKERGIAPYWESKWDSLFAFQQWIKYTNIKLSQGSGGIYLSKNVKLKRIKKVVCKVKEARRTNKCQMKHTPLAPHKRKMRLTWMKKMPKNADVITISHGAFDEFQAIKMLRDWNGKVFACDIDPGVRNAIMFLGNFDNRHKSADYDFEIEYPGGDILSTVKQYIQQDSDKPLVIDVDLAKPFKEGMSVLLPILETLALNGYEKVKIVFTFCKRPQQAGKRNFFSILKEYGIPRSMVSSFVAHNYYSLKVDEYAQRQYGSAMGVYEFTFG